MAYREDWVAEIIGDRSILELALDVHMIHTGSMERYDGEEGQEKDLKALRHIDATWKEGLEFTKRFDDAVREVIRATIAECDGQQSLSE